MAEAYEYEVYNADEPAMRSREPRPPRRRRHRLWRVLVGLALVAVLLWGLGQLLFPAPATADGHRDGCYTLLLAGTDGDGTRTDTMMLVYVDTDSGELALLSLPRDTLVDLNMSVPKLNGVYGVNGGGEEGMEALMDQATLLLGYRPDGYVLVDFDAVEQVVDILGGVEFDVPMDMTYSDPAQDLYIDLEAGLQTLTGQEALWVLRYRSGYAMADLDRVAVQRQLVQAVADQCLSLSTVTKLPQLFSVYQTNVQSDLSFGTLVRIGLAVMGCDTENVQADTLPGEAVWYQGGSYYQVDLEEAATLLNSTYNPLETAITTASLQVVNVVDGYLTVLGGGTLSASTESTTETVVESSAAASQTVTVVAPSAAPSASPSPEISSAEPEPSASETETPEASAEILPTDDPLPEETEETETPEETPEPSEDPSPEPTEGEPAQPDPEPSAEAEPTIPESEVLPTE